MALGNIIYKNGVVHNATTFDGNIKGLLLEFNEVFQWKIKEQRNNILTIVHTKILIGFVQALLKSLKCALVDVQNNFN